MSNDNNIQRLKRDFYRNHFGEFLLFLDNPNLNPQRSQLALMASSIASINKSLGFELYDEGKAPFLNLKVGPQEAVAAVEEFFDIMESDEEAITRVGRILNYLRDPAGHGTKAEMHDLKDDMIVRTICNHFWDMVNRKPLKAIPYQSKNGATTYEYDDFQPNNKVNKYQDLIMGPVMALLGEKYRIFTLFLHVVRKSRNKASHTDEFSDLAVGYQLYRFIMFVYVTTVLLIRKAQYPGNPYELPQIRMFIDGLYDNIKLTANGKELPMHKTEDGRHYYQVQWYQDYILEIDGKKADIRWGCKDLEPRAAKDDQGINTYSNDSQVDNDAHSASFHQAMDAFENSLVELRAIKGNTDSIPQIYSVLAKLIEQQERQNVSLEKITEKLDRFSESLSKPEEERNRELLELFGHQNQLIEMVIKWLDSNKGLPSTIKRTERNTQINKWLLTYVVTPILIIGAIIGAIWAIKYFFFRKPSLNAAEWVAKGDQCFLSLAPKDDSRRVPLTFEQARSISDQAGEAYRQAIKLYKDSLEQDSNNTTANISLATLLMRGKGDYDLQTAIKCAKRAKNDKRGLGLYAYLLFSNGEKRSAHFIVGNHQVNENSDPYLRLTKILLTLYGDDKKLMKQTEESIQKLIEEMETMIKNSPEIKAECLFHCANCILDGIYYYDQQNIKVYLLEPAPMYACRILENLSILFPRAFAIVSSVLNIVGDNEYALLYAMIAYGCGFHQISPLLSTLARNYFEPNKTINDYLDSISRNDSGKLDAKLNHLLYRLNKDEVYDDDYAETWELLELIKKDFPKQTVYDSAMLTDIMNLGTFLALRYGDVDKAAEWIATNEKFPDISAVKDYILFSCYYLNKDVFPVDSIDKIQSDSLLRSSYQKGYPKAISSLIIRQIMNAFYDEKIDVASLSDTVWKKDPRIATALTCYWMIRGNITDNPDYYFKFMPYSAGDFKSFCLVNQIAAVHGIDRDNYDIFLRFVDMGIAHAIQSNNTSLIQWYCKCVTDAGMIFEELSKQTDVTMGYQYRNSYYFYQQHLIDDSIDIAGYHYPLHLLSSPFDEYYRNSSPDQTVFDNLFEVDGVPIQIGI